MAMIRAALLGLLVASAAFADVKHLENLNKHYACAGSDVTIEKSVSASEHAAHSGPSAYPYGPQSVPAAVALPTFDPFDGPTAAAPTASSTAAVDSAAATGYSSTGFFAAGQQPPQRSSSLPEQIVPDRPPAFATAFATAFGPAFAPAYSQGVQITRSEEATVVEAAASAQPAPAHEVTVSREVPVPYYVQVETRVPYPVLVRVPHPYLVTVEKHVPYAVRVHVDRPVNVPQPYPVEVEKRVPYPVDKPVPYEVRVPVDRPYPVRVPVDKPVPYAVEKPVPYAVPVEKPVPYAVEKPVPYAVEKPVPYAVEKRVPYPVGYAVPVNVPVPVEVRVPVDRPVPYAVEKTVPYAVQVPYEVNVPVPVQQAPAQRFATVHYYQQSAAAVPNAAVGSAKAAADGSDSLFASVDSKLSQEGFARVQSGDAAQFGLAQQQQTFLGSSTPAAPFLASSTATAQFDGGDGGSNSLFESISAKLSEEGFARVQSGDAALLQFGLGQQQQAFLGSSTPAAPFLATSTAPAQFDGAAAVSSESTTTQQTVNIGGKSSSSAMDAAVDRLEAGKK